MYVPNLQAKIFLKIKKYTISTSHSTLVSSPSPGHALSVDRLFQIVHSV